MHGMEVPDKVIYIKVGEEMNFVGFCGELVW
jgi:hypothetical protein